MTVTGAESAEAAVRGGYCRDWRADLREAPTDISSRMGIAWRFTHNYRLRFLRHRRLYRRDGPCVDRRPRTDRRCTQERRASGVTRVDADNAELIAHGQGRRTHDKQRILAFNLGTLEDVATAAEIYRRAEATNAGTLLEA